MILTWVSTTLRLRAVAQLCVAAFARGTIQAVLTRMGLRLQLVAAPRFAATRWTVPMKVHRLRQEQAGLARCVEGWCASKERAHRYIR